MTGETDHILDRIKNWKVGIAPLRPQPSSNGTEEEPLLVSQLPRVANNCYSTVILWTTYSE